MPNKLRLAIVLPFIQVLLALVLLHLAEHPKLSQRWDTPYTSATALLCVGINAPVFPLITLGLLLPKSWQMNTVLGFNPGQAFFLIGVAVLWFWTGQAFDKWNTQIGGSTRTRKPSGMLRLLKFAWGILLLTVAVSMISLRTHLSLGHHVAAFGTSCLLFFAWAFVLIYGSLITFLKSSDNPARARADK